MLDDVQRDGGLSHRGARREDDQLTPLQPVGEIVEITESTGQSGEGTSFVFLKGLHDLFKKLAKPLSGGAVAVLLANRDAGGGPAVSVKVPLSELPGSLTPTGQYTVRDLYAHAEVGGALAAGALTLQAAPQGSQFVVLSPKKSTATTRHS